MSNDSAKALERRTKLSKEMSFRLLLQTLNDQEIVGEEAILQWTQERKQEQLLLLLNSNSNNKVQQRNEQQERRVRLY